MTTAIEQWGKKQCDDGQVGEGGSEHVSETDISGGDFIPHEGAGYTEPTGDADDAALAEKKAKDKKIMKYAGIGLGVAVLGIAGFLLLGQSKGGSRPQPYQAQAPVPVQPPVQSSGSQQQPELAPILAPIAIGPSAQPVDLGGPSNSPVALSVATPSGPALGIAPAAVNQLASPPVAARDDGPAKATASLKAEIEALTTEVASKDKVIEELRKELATVKALKVQAAPVAAPKVQAPPKAPPVAVVKKPVQKMIIEHAARASTNLIAKTVAEPTTRTVVDPQILKEPKQTPSTPSPAVKGGKVRDAFTVYAISNGRAWVTWAKDGVNYTVGANSELPDSSRVTSIDDVNGVVFTTAGEIHAKPPTR